MAVSFVDDSDHRTTLTDESPSTTSISVTAPTATAVGDFLAVWRHHSVGSMAALANGDSPINVGTYGLIGNNTNHCLQYVTKRSASDLDWAWAVTASTSRAWACVRFEGVDQQGPIRDHAGNAGGSINGDILGFGTSVSIANLDCAVAGCMAVVMIQTENATITTPSGWTGVLLCGPGAGGNNRRFYLFYKAFASAGTTSESVSLTISSSARYAGHAFVLNPRRSTQTLEVNNPRVAVLGDSITARPNVGTDNGIGRGYTDHVLGTPATTTTDGNTGWYNGWFNGQEIRFWVFGQSGANAREITANYALSSSKTDGSSVTPDVLVLNFGANDELDGRTTTQFRDDLVTLANGGDSAELPLCPYVLLIGQWAWRAYGGGGQPASNNHAAFLTAAQDAVALIEALGHVTKCIYVDVATNASSGGGTNVATADTTYGIGGSDYAHPNAKGHRDVWANTFRYGLETLLARVQVTHEAAASVGASATVTAAATKHVRIAKAVTASASVAAEAYTRFGATAVIGAEVAASATLTSAALTHSIAAVVEASVSADASASTRHRVAEDVGALVTAALLLGKKTSAGFNASATVTTTGAVNKNQRISAFATVEGAIAATARKRVGPSADVAIIYAITADSVILRHRVELDVNVSVSTSAIPEGAQVAVPVVGNVRNVYLTTYVKKRNRMDRLEISTISTEYIDVVFVSRQDVKTFPVAMALAPIGEEPSTWVDGDWMEDQNFHRGSKWFNTARCLAGTGGLDISAEGEYQLWIKVTGPSDTPVKKAGTVAVS